ncbi:MAG: ATPase V0/A0 complex, partial [Olpidium bornovanus]
MAALSPPTNTVPTSASSLSGTATVSAGTLATAASPPPLLTQENAVTGADYVNRDDRYAAAAAASTLFRSELMSLVQLYIPTELAQPTVSELGDLGLLEFNDLNADVNVFQRAFVNEIRRLDEMDRKLRCLNSQVEKEDFPAFNEASAQLPTGPRSAQEIDDLDELIAGYHDRIQQMNQNYARLQRNFLELSELKQVLAKVANIMHEAEEDLRGGERSNLSDESLVNQNDVETGLRPISSTTLEYGRSFDIFAFAVTLFITGVVPRSRIPVFERVLWRALRGNLYMKTEEITDVVIDPGTDAAVQKSVFAIFVHGKELMAKIRKISESLGATIYPVDADSSRRREETNHVESSLVDLRRVLDNTNAARRMELEKVYRSIATWDVIVQKEKAIYHAMNLFNYDPARKCLIAEGWCPTASIPSIQQALRRVQNRANSPIHSLLNEIITQEVPPTYHRTNKFTVGFQNIVDAYGVARYREVNPGLFTVISFPFLFAVMFGDVGHGFLVSCAAGYMVWKENMLAKKDFGEIFGTMFSGRYIILLMGLFSVYTGLIYNDIFSRALYIFNGSTWDFTGQPVQGTVTATRINSRTYPFGVDPVWHLADNALIFTNSYKMKMAILLGVVQMTFGICLTVYNHVEFKHKKYILAEFVPQVIFMLSIFGYLSFMIVLKWCTNFEGSATKPPSLLNMLIYMFLSPGNVNPSERMFGGQGTVQVVLVLVALACVPWMLLTKPLLIRREMKAKEATGFANHAAGQLHDSDSAEAGHFARADEGHDEHGDEASAPHRL